MQRREYRFSGRRPSENVSFRVFLNAAIIAANAFAV
jgi:hypothetical protein